MQGRAIGQLLRGAVQAFGGVRQPGERPRQIIRRAAQGGGQIVRAVHGKLCFIQCFTQGGGARLQAAGHGRVERFARGQQLFSGLFHLGEIAQRRAQLLSGGLHVLERGARFFQSGFQVAQGGAGALQALARQSAEPFRLVHRVGQLTGCLRERAELIVRVCQRRIEQVQRTGDARGEIVELARALVGPVRRRAGKRVCGGARLVGPIRKGGKAGGQVARDVPRVVQQSVRFCLQGGKLVAELLQKGLAVQQRHLRLQLAHNAANVLAALHAAAVGAAVEQAALPSGHTAGVVADVRIADAALIAAVLEDSGGVARHAPHVRPAGEIRGRVRDGAFLQHGLGCGFLLQLGGVDAAQIDALHGAAEVLAHNAARVQLAGQASLKGAARQLAARFIPSGNAAGVRAAPHRAGEGAAQQRSFVAPGHAAHDIARPGGGNRSLHAEILHDRALLDGSEQPLRPAVSREGKAGDGVAAAVEYAAEGGNAGKAHSRKVKIGFEHRRFPARPAVERTAFRKGLQILHGADVHRLLLSQRGDGAGEHQHHRGQKGCRRFIPLSFHRVVPPFPRPTGVRLLRIPPAERVRLACRRPVPFPPWRIQFRESRRAHLRR